ncbi:MAG: DUF1800 domain-containing protein, partial [Planctomycetota bacterium]
MDTSLRAIPAERFDERAARHLLGRAGYGGTPPEVKQLAAQGLDAAVDALVDYPVTPLPDLEPPDLDPDVLRPRTAEERQAIREARRSGDQDHLDAVTRQNQANNRKDRQMLTDLRRWWMQRMTRTPRPAEDRLTLLWHGHFATSHRSVRDTYLMYRQHALLREHANGNFADLARGIVRDPAMIKYLNNDRNHKNRPNENLARELMELFTLGVGNYSERDIKEGARALTGYGVYDNEFRFRENQHDGEPKSILGRTTNFDGDGFVELLLKQDACAKFVALKLYDTFVADVGDVYDDVPRPRQRVIESIARHLTRANYELRPVLKTVFKSRHFHDPAVVGKKIKDPTQLTVGTVRALGTPLRNRAVVDKAMAAMGQVLFEPPTVDGWDGGRAWINTSTLFVRQNLTTYLISGRHPSQRKPPNDPGYDPTPLRQELDA